MRTGVMAGTILMAALATDAAAQCDQSSLEGTQVFVNIAPSVPDSLACKLDVDGDGLIVNSLDANPDVLVQADCTNLFPGTQFVINDDCSVRLLAATCNFIGQLSRDGTMTSGIGFCTRDGVMFNQNLFNLVRQ
jgi:hypothetical protein